MEDILLFIVIGFLANIVDGCIGMAYGTLITSFFTLSSWPLLQISASIHFSEIFTSLASGLSHLHIKNVDFKLLKKIALPGVIGGLWGAFLLTHINTDLIKPFVAGYLLIIGSSLIYKSLKPYIKNKKKKIKNLTPLGLAGGFFDAVCGGGWGPIVSGTLLTRSSSPKKTIGTVNMAEFFVTLAQSCIFFTAVGLSSFKMVLGLIIGGVMATPFIIFFIKRINAKFLTFLVGTLIILTNVIILINFFKGYQL